MTRRAPALCPLPSSLLVFLAACAAGGDYSILKVEVDDDSDGYNVDADCDDADAEINPSAEERCDGVDNDCDDVIDGGAVDASVWYDDLDGDGYGDPSSATLACAPEPGQIVDGTDCDDAEDGVYPGGTERCDALDNDCDGDVDEDAEDVRTFYEDADGDGYGDPGLSLVACDAVSGYVADDTDCDDRDDAIHPDAEEEDCTDPVDYNCDGSVAYADADGDGAPACEDCDDTDAARAPGLPEVCDADDTDEDCSGAADDDDAGTDPATMSPWYRDADSDGYATGAGAAVVQCEQPTGYVALTGDCDDTDSARNPGETEVCDADDADEDCDGLADDDDAGVDASTWVRWHRDADSDGFGDASRAVSQCDAPAGYVEDDEDCDDGDAAINPDAAEICDPSDVDEDCDGLADDDDASVSGESTWHKDADSDGYGSTTTREACEAPSGYTSVDGDCDDTDADVNPGEVEVCDAASTDEDCDGLADDDDPSVSGESTWYKDADSDGYGLSSSAVLSCDRPSGYGSVAGDCDDADADANPGEVEVCDAAETDEDCDGLADDLDPSVTGTRTWYRDADGDDYGLSTSATDACAAPAGTAATAGDCDDADADVNPGELEVCDAADTDEDCDGLADDLDPSVTGGSTFYADLDGDGYGDAGGDASRCEASSGWVVDDRDCDDSDVDSYPGAAERCDDGVDQDCSGADLACSFDFTPTGEILSDSITTRVEGEAKTTFVGIMPVTHADLNGDGYDDYLVPAQGTTAGEVFVFYGPLEGAYTTTSTEAEAVITGATAGDFAYRPVPIGDQDGDGTIDLAIGAPGYNNGSAVDAGAVYVLPGSTTGAVTLSASYPVFIGDATADDQGRAVAPAGDTNEDGYADLFVGASGYSSGRGAVYLLEGPFSAGARSASTYASTTWVGEATSNYAGYSILGDVDLNDDGEEDVVISAWGYSSSKGRVYIYYGPFASGTITLGTATADAVFTGGAAGDALGWSVAVVPDMDGDGLDELAIGAHKYDDGASDTGIAYVFSGPFSGTYAPADAFITVTGTEPGGYLGYALAGLEDIDGDGRGELAVSCPACETDFGEEGGVVGLFYGGREGELDILDADVVYLGTGVGDGLGVSLTAGGDFDADGVPDLIMNAYGDEYEDLSYSQSGLVYFAPGSLDNRLVNGADATVGGVAEEGGSVSRAGDFNHDGYDDLLTASSDGNGSVMLYLGPLSGVSSSPDATFSGDASGDALGRGLDGGGRVNADAYDDLVIGAPYADSGASNAGEVYVITGRSTPVSYTAGTSAFANYYGVSASAYLGYSVSLVEDWDGDGYEDVLMGAPGYSSLTGRAYLVTAPASTHKGSVSAYADCTFTASSSGVELGVSVDGDGDIDADGFGDVVIGAPGWDSPTRNSGAAFVFYGGVTGTLTTSTADATLLGTSYDGAAGSAVAIVGDVNGDGYDDVVVGAPWEDAAGSSSGAAYLLLGPISGSSSLSAADASLEGVAAGEYVGESVDGVGDVNADGYDDWMTGGIGSDRGFENGGTAHLVYGPASGVAYPFTFHGPYDGSYAGRVSGAGDLNADGTDDLVIGGSGEDSAWIFFGH